MSARLSGEVIPLTPRPRPLRADVPPFDPSNPEHLRAWEALFDLGKREARHVR